MASVAPTPIGDLAGGASSEPPAARPRIRALDIVRGAVMVLMALDHVRWFISDARFDPTDLSQSPASLFLTRWVTHFCAPAFVFLAGAGAFLYGGRLESRRQLSGFLLVRGGWLILIELTLVRLGWTFNLDYAHYAFGGVIWMIGWCMICLAGLSFLPPRVVGMIGLGIIFGHNLLDLGDDTAGWLTRFLYLGDPDRDPGSGGAFPILFGVFPWVGVMAAGFWFGLVMQEPLEKRHRLCRHIGLVAILTFIVLRAAGEYGDPSPWTAQQSPGLSVLSFMNTTKYPASLLYLLMTLGPTVALIPWLERTPGRLMDWLEVFGRVPFAYYILHLPLIHLFAVLLSFSRYHSVIPWLTANHPMMAGPPPAGYGYGLVIVYLVTVTVVIALYFPCRRWAQLRGRSRAKWLSYL